MRDGSETSGIKAGLPPVGSSDARLVILGSLPGEASLAAASYYAHPRNQFWLLLGRAIGEDLCILSYQARLERLRARRIGLWDVIAEARRKGSLDQAIRSANHNRLEALLTDHPGLRAIAFNGRTAALAGRRMLEAGALAKGVRLIDLPSSSPANTTPLESKAAIWAELAPFAG